MATGVCLLQAALLLLALQQGQCLALRNPFAALWADPVHSSDVQQRRRGPGAVDAFDNRCSRADGRCGGITNDAERRHEINGVVTLVDGQYDFTYRPIAGGKCWWRLCLACGGHADGAQSRRLQVWTHVISIEGPARGAYTDSRHTCSGWSILHVHSNASYSDEQQVLASCLGMCE
jgi:hypothetical protein